MSSCELINKAWMGLPCVLRYVVGWQATQKCNLEYIIKKMDFFFTTCLFSAQRLKNRCCTKRSPSVLWATIDIPCYFRPKLRGPYWQCQIYGLPLTIHVILAKIWTSQFWPEITWDVSMVALKSDSNQYNFAFLTFGHQIKKLWRKNPSFLWCSLTSLVTLFLGSANQLKIISLRWINISHDGYDPHIIIKLFAISILIAGSSIDSKEFTRGGRNVLRNNS